MADQDLQDAGPVLDRIGELLDCLSRAGWSDLHGALAGYVRERRGKVKGTHLPLGPAKDLMNLLAELERLVDVLDPKAKPEPSQQYLEAHDNWERTEAMGKAMQIGRGNG